VVAQAPASLLVDRGARALRASAGLGELSAIVLGAQPLGAVLHRVVELAVEAVPGADDASVVVFRRNRFRAVAVFGPVAAALDERQYEPGFGPSLAATRRMIVLDTTKDVGYRGFSRQARRRGIHHVLAIPIPELQCLPGVPDCRGALNLYGTGAAGPFDRAAIDSATAFSAQASVTVLNALTYAEAQEQSDNMKQALASRAGIEQAKGILMGRHHCSAEEAFALLVDTASRSQRKVRDVAQAVIDDAITG